MQAIQTKYLGPTNHRGSRVKAACEAGSMTVSWDYALNVEENHKAAANMLKTKLGWKGSLETGWLPNKQGLCHVFTEAHSLASEVLAWAAESRDHGGNPYCYDFVKSAQFIRGEK